MARNFRAQASVALGIALALSCNAMAKDKDALQFPERAFSVETKTVESANGKHQIRYRAYRHIPYVAHPVSKEFQSLDVMVPVEVDGKPIDARHAPIVLNITVGGYLSASNTNPARRGPGPESLPPPGGAAMAGGESVPPPGAGPQGAGPAQAPRGGLPQQMGGNGSKADLALAAGYVVVTPGARGRDNKAEDGTYFGKAPAAIVDLKAAVRYVRHNTGRLPGNTEWIISAGCSAGGGLSALLGSSGDSPLYDKYLAQIGAAKASDRVFASACYSPITDLEHADLSYEWAFGPQAARTGKVDSALTAELSAANEAYQDSLGLQGRQDFGAVSGARLGSYLQQAYLQPAASRYLSALAATERDAYLQKNPWIHWDGQQARFAFADFASHLVRGKGQPAFDDFTLRAPETGLFGNRTNNARHFTEFSLRHATARGDAQLDAELRQLVDMMNPMYFIARKDAAQAKHWWLRTGSRDDGISPSVIVNLGTRLENHGKDVDTAFFWDGGHCADDDPQGMIDWIGRITGYSSR
ncbi:subtype B tannase [Niveibacterium terrae]|uniref:subtype B tannase n=1 Tax=Niveibacterium terrae TaxID=3373598 RepID=UPI003A954487